MFSSNKEFLEIIRKIIFPFYGAGSLFYDKAAKEWKLSLSSKEFRDMLVMKYNVPTGNKTKTMNIPKITNLQKIKFLEGLYDAEGWYEKDKGKYYRIKIKMKNKAFIEFIFKILQEEEIYAIFYDKGYDTYSIEINKQDQIKKFINKFSLYHPKWLLLSSS